MTKKCGFVALIGAPNAGKSTLLNYIVGEKISIVTQKAQTTRQRIRGIVNQGDSQIIFVDTPGVFNAQKMLEKAMVEAAFAGASEADEICLLVDASKGLKDDDQIILDYLKEEGRQVLLVLTKIDKIKKEKLLPLIETLADKNVFSEIFMTSATSGEGVDKVLPFLASKMPDAPWLYGEDDITDLPLRQAAAEITREKLFLNLHDELPYAIDVETELYEDFKNGDVKISQIVYIEKASQKPIVLGKGGARIKVIRRQAQLELENFLETKVHLFLHVKVKEDWKESAEHFQRMGLDINAVDG